MVRRVVRGVGRRLRVAAVEEAGVVVGPRGGRELAPLDAVGQLLAGVDAADPPAAPVRAGVAQGKRDELAALRDGHGREGGRALVAQGVGVEQDAAFRVGRVRPSRGRPGPATRCSAAGTSGRRGATERRRGGSPRAGSAGPGWSLDPDARREPSRSARSGRRSRRASPARRCPRAAGTGRRPSCRDSRRPGPRSGAWGSWAGPWPPMVRNLGRRTCGPGPRRPAGQGLVERVGLSRARPSPARPAVVAHVAGLLVDPRLGRRDVRREPVAVRRRERARRCARRSARPGRWMSVDVEAPRLREGEVVVDPAVDPGGEPSEHLRLLHGRSASTIWASSASESS